ncbi:MAG: hypothetical protein GY759_13730 [Chloroflexi bacterium]|nr:hypothetical protein [Chloroflexota bacterium]
MRQPATVEDSLIPGHEVRSPPLGGIPRDDARHVQVHASAVRQPENWLAPVEMVPSPEVLLTEDVVDDFEPSNDLRKEQGGIEVSPI